MSFNLATILTETALAAPDARVHVFGGTATAYRELDEQSGRFAAGLREAGLDPGDVVALQLPNLPQFLAAYFGALKVGMVVLPLNPLLMAPELEYHLGDSSARPGGSRDHLSHRLTTKTRDMHGMILRLLDLQGATVQFSTTDDDVSLAILKTANDH